MKYTNGKPIVGMADWNHHHQDFITRPLPRRFLIESGMLTHIYLNGTAASFQMPGSGGYVNGILRLPRGTYRITGWDHSIGALWCERVTEGTSMAIHYPHSCCHHHPATGPTPPLAVGTRVSVTFNAKIIAASWNGKKWLYRIEDFNGRKRWVSEYDIKTANP